MRSRMRQYARKAAIGLALVTAAGWLLPSFLSAERYRRRLATGLEQALHRSVTFGAISFRLLPRPGFSIENAVVREDPAFGSEPLARIDRIDCDLRWRSLWHSRLDLARLRLVRPSLNIVRDARGNWNIESLLLESGFASPPAAPPAGAGSPAGDLELEADEGRLNFKVGADKKPFALTGLTARFDLDRARRLVRFRLAGSPIRTDLPLPTPGVLEFAGEWTPGKDLEGPLDATLRTRNALLYDWVPIVTGRNPGIYGVLDIEAHVTGSIRTIRLEGQSRLSDLHRWEQIPPSDPMPWVLHFRGEFDRNRGRALVESLDVSFADSHLHISGSVDKIPASPELDLVVALERSRLEDLVAMGRRFWTNSGASELSGRLDGLVAIQGPWSERRYAGFLGAKGVLLNTPSGMFPISEVAVRIDAQGARLLPLRVTLAPRVELAAEGALTRGRGSSRYDLVLSAKSVPLRDLLGFARAVGVRAVQNLDAQGVGTATFHLAGSAWPLARPTLTGHAELRAARLLAPGLTEPLHLPRARILVSGDHVVADPVVAVLGTSVFTGRVEYQGERKYPWTFDVRANNLSLEEGSLWFDVLGHRRPVPLLERLPGLGSFSARRVAASNLFGALNAKGRFAVPALTYRSLALRDFRATVEISGRVIRVTGAKFRAGGGRGQGKAEVDLTEAPARVTAEVTLAEADLQSLAPRLPPILRRLRGPVSGTARLEARGLTREEMSSSLKGQATVRLRHVFFGDFDPLEHLARGAGWGALEPARGEVVLRSAIVTLRAQDRRVLLDDCALDLAGARLNLSGSYAYDGTLDLDVHADFRHVLRRWLASQVESDPSDRLANLHLTGRLDRLAIAPETQVSRVSP